MIKNVQDHTVMINKKQEDSVMIEQVLMITKEKDQTVKINKYQEHTITCNEKPEQCQDKQRA